MMTAYGTSQTAIEAMKRGAYDYVLKPFDIPQLKDLLFEALAAARAMKQIVAFPTKLNAEESGQTIVGNSPAMQQVYKLIGQVAPTSTTILITGESGTGKELVARAIYQNGSRVNKPFIAINCAAIPENLLESELFGHEKGAFTGALAQRIGKFEQCDGGTLFLDEIGDMPMTTQTKILRVLQEGEISRVGNNQSIKTDVRIIAATNKDLWQAVQRKEFREDLFYRLNVVRVNLPPLRERSTDIPLLVAYFINKFRLKQPTGPSQIADEALAAIQRSTWPGNVRELENCIQRAMVLASGNTITLANLPEEISRGYRPGAPGCRRTGRSGFLRRRAGRSAPETATPPRNRGRQSRAGPRDRNAFQLRPQRQAVQTPARRRARTDRPRAGRNLRQPGPGRQASRRHPRHPPQARRQIRHPKADGDRLEALLSLESFVRRPFEDSHHYSGTLLIHKLKHGGLRQLLPKTGKPGFVIVFFSRKIVGRIIFKNNRRHF